MGFGWDVRTVGTGEWKGTPRVESLVLPPLGKRDVA